MRHFFIILLLSIPSMMGATISAPPSNCESSEIQFSFSKKESGEKRGFFKRFPEKTLTKRLKKAMSSSTEGDGKEAATIGLVLGVVGALLLVIAPSGLAVLMGLAGLIFSVIGLKRSKRSNNKKVRNWAIVGVVINALLMGVVLFYAFSV